MLRPRFPGHDCGGGDAQPCAGDEIPAGDNRSSVFFRSSAPTGSVGSGLDRRVPASDLPLFRSFGLHESKDFGGGVFLGLPKEGGDKNPLPGNRPETASVTPNRQPRQSQARSRLDDPAGELSWDLVNDEVLKFLRSLRAVREYTPEPVSDADLQAILEVGRWTATGEREPQHEVVVVRDPEVRAKFAEWGAKPGAGQVALLIVSAGDANAFDEGRIAERLALAAKAVGLGSCIATLKNEGPDQAKALLGIPAEARARTLVSVGHADVEARKALPRPARARASRLRSSLGSTTTRTILLRSLGSGGSGPRRPHPPRPRACSTPSPRGARGLGEWGESRAASFHAPRGPGRLPASCSPLLRLSRAELTHL